MTDHVRVDLLYWLAFFFGQCLFMLKRTALAIRSPMNAMRSRTEYIQRNWDVLLIRTALEFALIFWPYRHVPIASLLAFTGWNMPFAVPQSAVVSFFLGFISDAMMDWLALQDSFLKFPIPSWIKETIPQLPHIDVVMRHVESTNAAGTTTSVDTINIHSKDPQQTKENNA